MMPYIRSKTTEELLELCDKFNLDVRPTLHCSNPAFGTPHDFCFLYRIMSFTLTGTHGASGP